MTGELLFEIGTEEIPSDYLDNALIDLGRLAEDLHAVPLGVLLLLAVAVGPGLVGGQ